MRVVALVEIQHSQVVVGRRRVRRQLQHGAIFFICGRVISTLLGSLGFGVKRLDWGVTSS